MSAPPKPWEGVGINARSSTLSFDSPSRLPLGAGGPRSNALRTSSEMSDKSSDSKPGSKGPPLPPRPQAQRSNGGMMYGGSRYGMVFVRYSLIRTIFGPMFIFNVLKTLIL